MSVEACKQEIETLHEFFVSWYCGVIGRDSFQRVEQALVSDFERVSPDGDVHNREEVLDGVERSYDVYDEFEIEVRNVEPVFVADSGRTLLRYEEWQKTPDGTTGRLSSALLQPISESKTSDSPAAQWHYLQETWLESPA